MIARMFFASAVLLVAACGDNDASEASRGEGREVASGTVDMGGKQGSYSVRQAGKADAIVTFKGPDGETATFRSGANAAEYLPDFAPLYPGATVTGGGGGDSKDGKGGMVSFSTKAAPDAVIQGRRRGRRAQGRGGNDDGRHAHDFGRRRGRRTQPAGTGNVRPGG